MKFKKDFESDTKVVVEFLKTQIGRDFNVIYSLEYSHGRMKYAKLLNVTEPIIGFCSGTAEFEATFPDGYKANYCTSIEGFFSEFKNQF